MNHLSNHLEAYLKLRRDLGFSLRVSGSLLRKFVIFAKKKKVSFVSTELALEWATQPADSQPAQWANRLSMVRCFAKYLSAVDPHTVIPAQGLLPHRYRRKAPYFYHDREVLRLMQKAKELPSPKGLRGATFATLLGLLTATGMRVGEVVRLDRDQVDLQQALLTVRHSKGNQSRLVPIHPSSRQALRHYERLRNRICPQPQSPSFFLSEEGARLTTGTVRHWFRQVSRRSGLRGPNDRRGPRLHDLRHRFAIQALLKWYRSNKDIEAHLPELATYLGHKHVSGTYWYLSATPELLRQATRRWEHEKGGSLS